MYRAEAREIASALGPAFLAERQAELDPDECHPVAIQFYWGIAPLESRLKADGYHVRLARLADVVESVALGKPLRK